jgi:hypothetical protein
MAWLTENWFWILTFIAFVAMPMFGHGGHGGDGGHRSPERQPGVDASDAASTRLRVANKPSDGHQR